jgi:indole-3-glycerol phosphate synthase
MSATTAADLLATIVAATRRAAAVRAARLPIDVLEREAARRQPDGAAFAAALRSAPRPRVIAECKRRSPSRGILRAEYRPAEHAASYERAGAAAISVLTEPTFFDGAIEHLRAVREAVRVPLLRKDFIVSRYQIVEAAAAGADAALLIVGALDDDGLRDLLGNTEEAGLAALVEAHDEREAARAVEAGARVIGVNSRDLRTLTVDPSVHERVARTLPRDVTLVAESGLSSPEDFTRLEAAGYHAFLVGERLISQDDPGAALRALRGGAA